MNSTSDGTQKSPIGLLVRASRNVFLLPEGAPVSDPESQRLWLCPPQKAVARNEMTALEVALLCSALLYHTGTSYKCEARHHFGEPTQYFEFTNRAQKIPKPALRRAMLQYLLRTTSHEIHHQELALFLKSAADGIENLEYGRREQGVDKAAEDIYNIKGRRLSSSLEHKPTTTTSTSSSPHSLRERERGRERDKKAQAPAHIVAICSDHQRSIQFVLPRVISLVEQTNSQNTVLQITSSPSHTIRTRFYTTYITSL